MSVKSKTEILESIKTRFGDNTDDESISFLEDITDTLTDLETKANGDGTDWKAKYEENDTAWRKKYTDRFYSNEPDVSADESNGNKPDGEKPKTFSDLFKND